MLFANKVLAMLHEDATTIGLPKLKPYQRLGARGLNRKNQQQVPKYRKGRGDLNSKVEQMRKGKAKKQILSPKDVGYIKNRYKIKNIGSGKKLGTTDGTISVDPVNGRPILTRK